MPTTEIALNAELQGYETQFLEAQKVMRRLVEDVDDAQFNLRPEEGQWSMAECIDHLVVMGNHMMLKIDAGIEKGREKGWTSDGPFKNGPVGKWFIRAVGPRDANHTRTFKAPPLYTPTSNHSISRLNKAFIELQDDFVSRVHAANGLDLWRIKMTSPVSPLIRFSLGQWFALLTGHQQRHFQQAEVVKKTIR